MRFMCLNFFCELDLEYDSKIIVKLFGKLSTIPCLCTRFVAYLAVLAGVIGESVKV